MRCIAFLLTFILGVSAQDTLVTNSGHVYLGKVMGLSKTSVKFLVTDGVGAQQVQLERVSRITNSGGEIMYDSNSGLTQTSFKQEAELSYEQTQDIEFAKTISSQTHYNSYLTKDGTLIKIGDSLIVGSPATTDKQYSKYVGTLEVFSTIRIGGVGMSLLAGSNYFPASGRGSVFTIEKIYVSHTKLSKKSPLSIFLTVREPDLPTMVNKRTIGDLEHAILLGEIISPNAPMTRVEAIAKLKESKDLLELEIITQTEYDELKVKLTPIIRGE
jgi:hypothetical protein